MCLHCSTKCPEWVRGHKETLTWSRRTRKCTTNEGPLDPRGTSETTKKVWGQSTGKEKEIQMPEDPRTAFKDINNLLRGLSLFYFYQQRSQVRDPWAPESGDGRSKDSRTRKSRVGKQKKLHKCTEKSPRTLSEVQWAPCGTCSMPCSWRSRSSGSGTP